mgnify:CR=1 FL=1
MIYLDNAATTRPCPAALDAMRTALEDAWGNPSALYRPGQQARKLVEDARRTVARVLHAARPAEITFTSGGTESDVQALYTGAALGAAAGKRHIISTQIEHHAVLHTLKKLEKEGFKVVYVPVDEFGIVKLDEMEKAITEDVFLVSVMTANNEIGTLEPVAEIGTLCHERGVLFHTDAVQAVGAIPLDVEALHADMISLSAHKFHGPKGIGALYIRKGVKIDPLIHGGAQERGHRAGTENLPGIVGLGKAIELAEEGLAENAARMTFLRNRLISGLTAAIPNMRINGTMDKRLPNNVNVSFAGIEGEAVLLRLDLEGIAASSGSACTAGSLDPSHVLTAIGLTRDEAKGSLRLTLGTDTTQADIDEVVKKLPGIVASLREMTNWCGRG